jgi:hypothetical protein
MLYVVIDNASGAQQRVATAQLFQKDASEAVLTFPDLDAEPSPDVKVWDRATRTYIDAPNFNGGGGPISRTRGTRLEFRRKVGFTRESQLHQLLRKSALPDATYGDLTTMLQWLNSATDVQLTDADTIVQANTLGAIYSNAGLMGLIGVTPMTTEEAAAYVAEILTPWDTAGTP